MSVEITDGQRAELVRALADAIYYRGDVESGPDSCHDCQMDPDGTCDDHLNDMQMAETWRELRAFLWREGDE